jgi:hypothetical protein
LFIEWALAGRPDLAAQLLRYYWFRQADVVVPLAVAIGAVTALGDRRRTPMRMSLVIAVGAALAAWHLIAVAADRVRRPLPPATVKLDDLTSWQGACTWIRENAPADAVCLVPRNAQSFKWYAHRADVVNWKDVPQDAAGVVEWRRRLHDIYPEVEGADGPWIMGSPEQWGARRVREVAERYGVRYVVARITPPLPLRRVYPADPELDTEWYAVYDMAPAANEDKP